MKKIHDICFIGAGASALMASSHLQDYDVALIDSNPKIGAKLLISGGGKCNLTNRFATENNYLGDASFIAPILSAFDASSTLAFVKSHHLSLEERAHGQMFCANSAKELISIFGRLTKTCTFYLSTNVQRIEKKEHFVVQTDKGEIYAKKVVVAEVPLRSNWPNNSILLRLIVRFNEFCKSRLNG